MKEFARWGRRAGQENERKIYYDSVKDNVAAFDAQPLAKSRHIYTEKCRKRKRKVASAGDCY